MKLLVLDTSTERGIVACVEGQKNLFSIELPYGLLNSQHLIPELARGLSSIGLNSNQLSGVVVGIGPGSYTGIRVGVTVAKTLSFACNIPLIGVCTLETFIPTNEGVFAVVIDAKIGGVYLQIGKYEKGLVTPLYPRSICSLAEALIILKDSRLIVTPNAQTLRPKLEALCSNVQWDWEECYPSPMQMAFLGSEKLLKGECPSEFDISDTTHLDLLYMRKTQAEIERDKLSQV